MKEIVIISGKGGTGKTSLMAAFSSLAGNTARVKRDPCTECGLCRQLCRWNCISESFEVDPIGCEGCGVCLYFCPADAIEFPENTCGEWFISNTRFGPMVHARLGIAEENSGKLVTVMRQEARKLAEDRKDTG